MNSSVDCHGPEIPIFVDLFTLIRYLSNHYSYRGPMKLSIIIPALNEADILGQNLQSLRSQHTEIIVVDGGSTDGTMKVACQYTSNVVVCRKGRGFQQDHGARHSKGDVLLFLHADTRLPSGYYNMVRQVLADPQVIFGAFYLSIYQSTLGLRVIALTANLRSRFLKLPYGDQALFVRRTAYFQVGGFQDLPIMEDVDLVRKLNRAGRFRLARAHVLTSARRWHKENPVYTTLRNLWLMTRYSFGSSPHSLARHYRDVR